jgi:predicted ribosome quality control (RQC) complex YloA/Tae2 family protein
MPTDALAISALRRELYDRVVGGRIQNLLTPGPLSLSLEIYRAGTGRIHLLMSAHPQHARVHLLQTPPTRDPEQRPPLLLLLRKYVRGGTLLDAYQPPYERVLVLSIAKRIATDKHQEYHLEGDFRDGPHEEDSAEEEDYDAPITEVRLYVEVMGRLSNIVLVGADGVILDSIKRVPPSINRYRVTLPKREYIPPPPQEKRDPMRASINSLSLELTKVCDEDSKVAAWKGLVAGFLGVSPPLAREVTFRALGDTAMRAESVATEPDKLAKLLVQLQQVLGTDGTGEKSSVAWRVSPDGDRTPLDFAPYALTHLASGNVELSAHDGISDAISSYYASLGSLGSHSALKGQVRAEIKETLGREERKLAALREQLRESEALEGLRHKGEMVLSYMHTLQPGQRRLELPEEGLVIELDPALTPVENAQAIFREYRKAKAAHEGVPALVEAAELSVEYWDGLLTSLEVAAAYDDIRAVQAEARAARTRASTANKPAEEQQKKPTNKKGKAQDKTPQPLRTRTRSGTQVLVGRTAGQNDTATFRLASPEDLWFHARGVPGAHVILRAASDVTSQDIEEAAALAAAYSKLRSEAQVDVLYTERRYVRRIPNGPPGSATYKNERVIRVAPVKRET